jgi:hypothetical protein
MRRQIVLCLCVILASAAVATAQEVNKNGALEVGSDKHQDVNQSEQQKAKTDTQLVVKKGDPSDPKELSGMSIVGNEDAPKSLYIVPWKSSEIGAETSLDTMLNEGDMPVDREVFRRQVEFYQVSTKK